MVDFGLGGANYKSNSYASACHSEMAFFSSENIAMSIKS